MKTTTNNNQTRALMVIDQTAARIEAAHRRHANQTPAVIIMPPFTASNPTAAEECTNSGHAAAYVSIRARHQASGLDFMERLNRQQHADRRREDLPRIAAEAIEARRQHDQHREQVTIFEAIAARVTTAPEAAQEAAQLATMHRTEAAKALHHAEALERVITTTSHTDRADISQAAAAVMWETGNFALACKAAGKAIGAVAAANGCTATRTKVKPITAAEAEAITSAHPNADRIPFNTREGLTAGFTTIEYRNSKRFPAGYYEVKHYHTAAPCISYETFATDEDAPQLATNGGINIITDRADADELTALFDRAKLSERERLIVRYIMDNTAAAAGIKAVADHQRETAERVAQATSRKAALEIQRDADRRTERVRYAAQRENAMHRAGVYAKANQDNTISRIRAKLEKAMHAPTEATEAEKAARTMQTMQSNRHRESQRTSTKAAPMFSQTISRTLYSAPDTRTEAERRAAREYAAQDVAWREDYPQPQTINREEAERLAEAAEQERRQHQQSHRAEAIYTEYRRAFRDYQPSMKRAAITDAKAAYMVFFFQQMTKAEQMEEIAGAKATEAARALIEEGKAREAAEAEYRSKYKADPRQLDEKAAELYKAAEQAKSASQRDTLRTYAAITSREARRAAEYISRATAAAQAKREQLFDEAAALREAAAKK